MQAHALILKEKLTKYKALCVFILKKGRHDQCIQLSKTKPLQYVTFPRNQVVNKKNKGLLAL